MNTFPFNKPLITANLDFTATPYTSKNIVKKPQIIEINYREPSTSKFPKIKKKYLFYILICFIIYYSYQNYTYIIPKIISKIIPQSLLDKLPLSYKNKLQNILRNMSQSQEFEYKPLNLDGLYRTREYNPQINIEDKIYFNDYFLDHELRKILDIDDDIIITKSHLDSIKGVLTLRDRRIEHILGLENMTNITGIDLSTNSIEYIPYITKTTMGLINKKVGIFDKIKDLQYINLASNKLINIDYIYKKNLSRLDLSNNGITSIKIIGQLYNLEYLNIANNFITDIYPLTKLKKLNFLNISYNYINKSPKVKHYYDIIKTKNKHLGKFLYKPQKKLENI